MRRALAASAWICAALSCSAACKTVNNNASVKVTNGIASNDFPSVVWIHNYKSEIDCTGTFVSTTTLITAAHCLVAEDNGGISFAGTRATKAIYAPLTGNSAALKPTDLAVVIFPEKADRSTSPVATHLPHMDDEVTLVGFGRLNATDPDSGGTKRYGKNTISQIDSGLIFFRGVAKPADPNAPTGTLAASASGDSGGPIFIDGAIVGVTTGGGVEAHSTDPAKPNNAFVGQKRSFYVSLVTPVSCELMRTAVAAGAVIPSLDDLCEAAAAAADEDPEGATKILPKPAVPS